MTRIDTLRPSQYSQNIYSHEPSIDLIESIRTNGLLVPVWITNDGIIISGHRRVEACKKLGIEEIETEIKEYSDSLVIEANRYREKTWAEKIKEAAALDKIEKQKAEQRMKAGTTIDPVNNSAQGKTREKVAEAVGTSHDTLHKAQIIARERPELLEQIDSGKKTVNNAYQLIQRNKKLENFHHTKKPFPTGIYNVIYADPPWQYEHSISQSRDIENQYPTMTTQDICSLPVSSFIADQAILFLWATNPKLEEALSVIKAWGFNYRTNMVWIKDKIGMGYYVRQQHELLLIGKKGDMPPPEETSRPSSIINSPREEHSLKPPVVYELIQQMYPNCSYIELFARDIRPGWKSWGNEV